MRGASTGWLPLATLVVGVAIGWLAWGGQPGTGPGGELAADGGEASTGPRPDLLGASGPGLSGSGAEDPLRAALATIPVPPVERGDGVVEGTVRDEQGNAVVGVRVSLRPQPDRGRFYPKERPEDPEEAVLVGVRGQLQQFRWQQALGQETATDGLGRYRFEGVTDRVHDVRVTSPGWRFAPVDYRAAREVRPGATVDFVGSPRSQVRIEVVGADVPDELSVTFASGSRTRGTRWRKADPLVEVEPGTYEVTAKGGESEELRGGPVPVTVERGGEPPVVQLALELRPVLRLLLAPPEDERMGLEAFLVAWDRAEPPGDGVLRASRLRNHYYPRSQPGTTPRMEPWQVSDLQPGRYVLGLSRGHMQPFFHRETIDVVPGVQERTVEVPALDPDEYVIVAVRGPDGELTSQVSISTGFRGESGSASGGGSTAIRRDGRILVMHQTYGVAPGATGTYTITAQREGYGAKTVEYVPGRARELEIRFREPGDLRVRVKGAVGSAYEGRVGVGLTSPDRHSGVAGANLDAEGDALLKGIQPGSYLLTLTVQSGQHGPSVVASRSVEVREGANALTVTLPPLHEVKVRGATGHVFVSRQQEGEFYHQSQIADKEGVAVFDGLPAGTYSVQAGGLTGSFTVPGAAEVTLEPRKR